MWQLDTICILIPLTEQVKLVLAKVHINETLLDLPNDMSGY